MGLEQAIRAERTKATARPAGRLEEWGRVAREAWHWTQCFGWRLLMALDGLCAGSLPMVPRGTARCLGKSSVL